LAEADRPATVSEPRLAAALAEVAHESLQSGDEWQNERVESGDLVDADADRVEITGCALRGVRLTGSRLEHLRLIDVLAVDCELSGAILTEATLWRVEFRNCRMSGLVISDSKLRDVRFRECKLDDANFRFVKAERVELDGCSLVEADFTESTFQGSAFLACDLRRAVLTKASMRGTRLAGSNVEELIGAGALRGVIVGTDQVLPLALAVFADLGIVVRDDDPV
jgi:uncharacterized protein YjbI with pentapeptide repeats